MFNLSNRFLIQYFAPRLGQKPVFRDLDDLRAHFHVPVPVKPGHVWEVGFREHMEDGRLRTVQAAIAFARRGDTLNLRYAEGLTRQCGLEFMNDTEGRWYLTNTMDTGIVFDADRIASALQRAFSRAGAIVSGSVMHQARPLTFLERAAHQLSLMAP